MNDAQKSIYLLCLLKQILHHPSSLRYSKAKAVNSIVRHVAEILGIKTNEELEDLYRLVKSVLLVILNAFHLRRKTAWYFETRAKKQGTAYDYFKQSVADPT